jgi:cytochrome oxidase Cu insertion factor (SCO1/SenC/PrrC family)
MTSQGAHARLTAVMAAVAWLLAARVGADAAPPPPGGPAPNFALTTQREDRLWLAQLRGRAVVLAFGCTRCGVCPALVNGLAEVARGLGDAPGRGVVFALVTVDPAHDTPAALRAFARARGLGAPAWVFFTEERPGEVDLVARRYGVEVRRAGERIEASCPVTLIDATGAIRSRYEAGFLDDLRRDLRALLALPAG